jgi:hypothetical protein
MEVASLEQNLHQGPINLAQLIGGRQLLVDCSVSWEGKTATFKALVDTGANTYALINQKHTRSLTNVLQMPVHELTTPIPLRGFDGRPSKAIRQVLEVDLVLYQCTQPRQYLLVAELGSHDLILGRKWLAAHDILPDCRRNRLYWPEEHQADQWDSNRRDQLFGKSAEAAPTKVLKRTDDGSSVLEPEERPSRQTKDLQTRKAEYQRQKEELDIDTLEIDAPSEPDTDSNEHSIAICFIGAAAYQISTRETGCYTGSVTIDEINYTLEKQGRKPPNAKKQQASKRRTLLLRRPQGPQPAGCHALAKDVVYTLEEDEQDALGRPVASPRRCWCCMSP